MLLHTNGRGYWSRKSCPVDILHMELVGLQEEDSWGELRVYFSGWDAKDGLIYTDPQWLMELRQYLREDGFSEEAVLALDYSEQGMQGDDYVSLDTKRDFIKAWQENKK